MLKRKNKVPALSAKPDAAIPAPMPNPLPAPAGAVAPANLPTASKQVIAVLPKLAKKKRVITKPGPVAPAASQPEAVECVAKDMGHHYCVAQGCPTCIDLASRG